MRILLASPRGFCAGVNMAIQSLELALERFGPPVYVYHEIVHNRWVVEHFRDRGAIFVEDLSLVPEGGHLLYSAHGVSPEIRAQAARRRLATIDATCPLVIKVHREASRFAAQGYSVILIGHEGHDEVVGVMGEAPQNIILVEDVEDVDRLELADASRIAYLTQTTLSLDDARRISDRLRSRFPHIVGPPKDGICYATQNRQQAVRNPAGEVGIALVVGSQNSSNSQRLAELARAGGVQAHLIDGPADIDLNWFGPGDVVMMTAGASAPEDVVQECVRLLQDRFQATVESYSVRQENVRFALPRELAD